MPSEFTWTDELVQQYGNLCHHEGWHKFSKADCVVDIMEQFKQSKIKEKERIEVMVFNDGMAGSSVSIRPKNGRYGIPKEKNESIKQAIESILNNEQPKEDSQREKAEKLKEKINADFMDKMFQDAVNQPLSGELITKEECERREEAAWYAAREKFAIDRNPLDKQYRYISFEYYKQSLKQK